MNIPRHELIPLIHGFLDGTLDPEQAASLNAQLRADSEARDLYLQLTDTHSCLAVDEGLWIHRSTGSPHAETDLTRARRFSQKTLPLTAAAAGVILGILCSSMVFAYVAPARHRARNIFAEGFESAPQKTTPGIPRSPGTWSGDEAGVSVSTRAVQPHSGQRMLQFLSATHPNENSPRSLWGDIYRVIDLSTLADSGKRAVRVSAWFAQGPKADDRKFSCSVHAILLEKELNALPERADIAELLRHSAASASRKVALSSGGTWKEVAVDVPLSPQTRYLVLHLAIAQDQPQLSSGSVNFPGHFVDDVQVSILDGL